MNSNMGYINDYSTDCGKGYSRLTKAELIKFIKNVNYINH